MKITLGKKLGVGFGIVIALMIFSTALAYLEASRIQEVQSLNFDVRIPTVIASKDFQRDMNQMANKGRQAVLSAGDKAGYQDGKRLYDEQGNSSRRTSPSWTNSLPVGIRPTATVWPL